jgi:hypothetical protein
MWPYKKGFLTVIEDALIYIKGHSGKAKTIFTFETKFLVEKLNIAGDNTILICVKNSEHERHLICLLEGHRGSIKDQKKSSVKIISARTLNKLYFYDKIVIFGLTPEATYYVFGSNVVITSPNDYQLYIYSFSGKTLTSEVLKLPVVKFTSHNCAMAKNFFKVLLCNTIDNVVISDNHCLFRQGASIFCLRPDLTSPCFHDEETVGTKLVGALLNNENKIELLGLVNETETKTKFMTLSTETKFELTDKRCIMHTLTNKVLKTSHKKSNIKYKVCDGKYKFSLPFNAKCLEFVEVSNGLIVLVSDKSENACVQPKFELKGDVLIATAIDWNVNSISRYAVGIFALCNNGWCLLSLQASFEIRVTTAKIASDTHGQEVFGFASVDYVKECSFEMKECIGFYGWVFATRATGSILPTFCRATNASSTASFEPAWSKKATSLVKISDKYYCFDGSNFVPLHKKISQALLDLTTEQFNKISALEIYKQRQNPDYVTKIMSVHLLEIQPYYRSYSLNDAPCDTQTIMFYEDDNFLKKVLLARKVHSHNKMLNFGLIGSHGSGPSKVVSGMIARQFVEKYFKLDGFFLVPNEKFLSAKDKKKFILGWILHNILHLTNAPIVQHLPLALLCALVRKEATEIELEHYAKLADPETYAMMETMDTLTLKTEGYNDKLDWLSMLCRYSPNDIVHFVPFANGFRSFSLEDHFTEMNLVTMDDFLSGSYVVDPSHIVMKLSKYCEDCKKPKQVALATRLVDKLLNASNSELTIFAQNINGIPHLNGKEHIKFDNHMQNAYYKFSVCFSTLYLSDAVEISYHEFLIADLFKIQQARLVN